MTEKKDTWKTNFLEFFHNNFIGISHLECQIEGEINEDCPIVDNWDEIEEKKTVKKVFVLYTKLPVIIS